MILGFRMCLDDTAARAIDRARPYFEEHAKFMAPLGMLRYSEEQVTAVAARQAQSPTVATLENGVAQPRAGSAARRRDIVAYLKELEAQLPRPGARHDRVGAGHAARADDRAAHPLRARGHAGAYRCADRPLSRSAGQFTTSARGACVTGSAPRFVTIDVSPRHMLSPVRLFSRIMWMKNTMPGASS